MWQHVKLSDVSLGTRSRNSLVADQDVKKPTNQANIIPKPVKRLEYDAADMIDKKGRPQNAKHIQKMEVKFSKGNDMRIQITLKLRGKETNEKVI